MANVLVRNLVPKLLKEPNTYTSHNFMLNHLNALEIKNILGP